MYKFLFWLSSYLPLRIISEGDRPYLERYHLFSLFGVTFDLHRFVSSDPDRGVHSHPWTWGVSFILCGYYFEEGLYDVKKITWINFISTNKFHRVMLPREVVDQGNLRGAASVESPCWTLFIHPCKGVRRPWGFLRKTGDKGEMAYEVYDDRTNYKDCVWWKTAKRRGQE